MKRAPVLIALLSALLLGAAALAQAPLSQIDTHIVTARTAAGQDYRATFVNLCLPSAPRGGGAGAAARRGARGGAPQTPDRANWYAPPFKVFDNLYWLGTRQHSSWALQTSAGIIIIDTNFAWATEPEIIDGLTKLGLNPRDIKYVIISHAHGDHDQGAAELQKRYGAQVVMGAPDWEATLKRPATAAGGVPKRDIAVGPEGRKLTLGDTTVEIVFTPGHSPGTLSYVFPVKDEGAHGDGRLFWRHADRRLRHRRRAVGRIHRLAAQDRQGRGRCGRQRPALQPQRVRRRLHEGATALGAASAGRRSSVHRRDRRRAALLHRDDRVRDGVQAAGGREVVVRQVWPRKS